MAEEKALAEEKEEKTAAQDNEPNSNQDAAEGPKEEQPPKKNYMKLGLFVGGPILLLIICATVLYFLGVFGSGEEPASAVEEVVPIEEQLEGVSIYKLPSMLINLRGTGKRTNFLKITMSLEVKSEEDPKHTLEKLQPRILDQFQTYLRELEVEDLQGSAGLQRLKEELLDRANAVTGSLKVQNVLFVELLVQ